MAAGTTSRSGRGRNARVRSTGNALPPHIVWVFGIVTLLYLALAGRLVYLQVFQHEEFKQIAAELRRRRHVLPARRGLLLDRDGTLLVGNERAGVIVLDPNLWYVASSKAVEGDTPEARRVRALDGLAGFFPDLDVAALALKVSKRRADGRFPAVDVRRQVDWPLAQKIQAASLPGVGVLPESRRAAVNGALAAHVLGFTDLDGRGLDGLEKTLDAELRGIPGVLEAEFDPQNRPIPGTVRRHEGALPGKDVVLTLDADVQHEAQEALKVAYETSKAESATVVVLDPRTGDILALANYPTYDINRRKDSTAAARTNIAVTAPFEPGSTLKVITVAAALEEGKVSPDTYFYCSGARGIGRRTIHCAHGTSHGRESLLDVIKNSCNIATADCAFRLGKERLWEYERAFGFGERTGSGLAGESRGLLSKPDKWSDIQLSNVAFGQGISVTPLQLAAAYAAIANDGVWMRQRIVRGVRNGEGGVLRPAASEPGRRVVSAEAAREMRRMLQSVVDDGTGKAAQMEAYTAGGKTGTAQIARGGRYVGGKYVASFVGMAPMKDPKFVVLVSVTAPKGAYYGGVVAGPVFKRIL